MNRQELLPHLGVSGLGIEIGVQSGDYARMMLEVTNLHLILLDSWRKLDNYPDMSNIPTENNLWLMNNALKTLMPYEGRFTIMRELSEVAVAWFKDELFDFVYLDANHSEAFVSKDLELWWPKVKKGGIMAGHDYLNLKNEINDFGVKTAVDRFFTEKNHLVGVVDHPFPTWYVRK